MRKHIIVKRSNEIVHIHTNKPCCNVFHEFVFLDLRVNVFFVEILQSALEVLIFGFVSKTQSLTCTDNGDDRRKHLSRL